MLAKKKVYQNPQGLIFYIQLVGLLHRFDWRKHIYFLIYDGFYQNWFLPSPGYCLKHCFYPITLPLFSEGALSSRGAERESQAPPGAGPQRCCNESRQQERPQLSCVCTNQGHKCLWCKSKCVCVCMCAWTEEWYSLKKIQTEGLEVGLVRMGQAWPLLHVVAEFQLSVPASFLRALECCTASPQCAGTATRVTTSLFNALVSLPQFCICCSLHLQHAGKACPNCLILWQSTLVNPLWGGFEKERRLFLINFSWDSLMGCWMSQPEHVSKKNQNVDGLPLSLFSL